MKAMRICLALVAVAMFASTAKAVVIASEDFDGGAFNLSGTANVFDLGAGGGAANSGDIFGRVSQWAGGAGLGGPFDVWDDSVISTSGGAVFPTDSRAIAGQLTTAFFAMNDMDGSGIPPGDGSLNDATWTFDISGGPALASIQIDIAAMGDFEAGSTDGFLIEARIDGNAYTEIFKGRTDEAASMVYRLMDSGGAAGDPNDPLEVYIDGVQQVGVYYDKCDPTTGLFDTYTSLALAGGTGSTLDVKISWAGTPSGSEPMGMDNITINGVPEPATLAMLLVGGLMLRRRR